jgi:hypothetical protein
MRENREIPESPTADGAAGRIGKADGRTPMMHDSGRSDRPVVPTKPSNNADPSAAERVEGRGLAKGNTDEQNAPRTQRRTVGAPNALDRVRQRASKDRKAKFTTLLHHVTVDRLREAFLQLQRKAAPGVDGISPSLSRVAGSVKWCAATLRTTPCQRTFERSRPSELRSPMRGIARFGDAVNVIE